MPPCMERRHDTGCASASSENWRTAEGLEPQSRSSHAWRPREIVKRRLHRPIKAPPLLLGAELPERAEPVLEVVRLGDLAVLDGLNVDRHHSKTLAGMGRAKKGAGGRAGHLAAHDHSIASHEHFFYVELHVGNRSRETSHDFDRGIPPPALRRQIPRAG